MDGLHDASYVPRKELLHHFQLTHQKDELHNAGYAPQIYIYIYVKPCACDPTLGLASTNPNSNAKKHEVIPHKTDSTKQSYQGCLNSKEASVVVDATESRECLNLRELIQNTPICSSNFSSKVALIT